MVAWHVRGLVLPDDEVRDVYVVDGRFSFEPVEDAVPLATDLVLVPGLVDAHAHLSLFSPAGDQAPAAERVRASARAHLDAGVLALREPGSPDRESAGLGPTEGLPRVTTAGRFLARPDSYFPGLAREVTDDELPAAALEELAASGHWVKLIGDSPWPGPEMVRTFSDDAIAEAVRVVHASGGRVAMHCVLPETVHAAVGLGVDTLEHGTLMQVDQVSATAEAGTVWVPTMVIDEHLDGFVPPHLLGRIARHGDAVAAAHEAGVTILAGTDAGMGPHGLVREEIALLARAGLPAGAALGAGSWTARSVLGLAGIEHDAVADLVGFRTDPREDLGVLAHPALVVLDGQVLRQP